MFSVYPIKVLYDFSDELSYPVKAGVTTSSRNFKKAVQRNRVKRILREAYRLQKIPLQNVLKEQNKSIAVFFIYIGKELPVFNEVWSKMGIIMERLIDHVYKEPSSN
jgi:ribonuclease P protein component